MEKKTDTENVHPDNTDLAIEELNRALQSGIDPRKLAASYIAIGNEMNRIIDAARNSKGSGRNLATDNGQYRRRVTDEPPVPLP